jgi:calcineurin-like phosphoesterase family protein
MNFFTADTHFGHENIVKYCGRPFKNAHQMDKTIIERYNAVVGPTDTCYFLGDFSMSGNPEVIERYVKKLNGKKILVLGNHDRLKPFTYVDLGFASVHTSLIMTLLHRVICVHDPAPACDAHYSHRWLVGHVHGLFKDLDRGRVTNVGVDVWGFFPVSEEQLEEYWRERLS